MYEQRVELGNKCSRALEKYWDHHETPYAKTGVETLESKNGFLQALFNILDRTISFLPDYAIVKDNEAILIEAKTSKTIDQDAYEAYLKYSSVIAPIMVIIYDDREDMFGKHFYYQYIDQITFVQKHMVKKQDGYIDNQWRVDHDGTGSGKPYGLINLKSMVKCDKFKAFL